MINIVMEFQKYQHIERYGNDEVEGIELGTCHIFPKIDGTNGSVWNNGGILKCGSHNRELSIGNDNQGFMEYIYKNEIIKNFLLQYPSLRLFGEWLVPHSLKTYRDDAWKKFYVFDVMNDEGKYLSYDKYQPIFEEKGIEYIPRLIKITNGKKEDFEKALIENTYLIKENSGIGEGIVIKNYEYRNKYGRVIWAKIVTNEFKDKHRKEMGDPEINRIPLEIEIVDKYLTKEMIIKTFEKIKETSEKWDNRMIPNLLSTIYHDFIIEEIWNFIKAYKNPIINFKIIQYEVTNKIKRILTEIF